MVAVLCHVVSPTGKRGHGWRPSSIAKDPLVLLTWDDQPGPPVPYCEVKFNVIVWG